MWLRFFRTTALLHLTRQETLLASAAVAWLAASEEVRWTTERAALLTDHNNRVSHGRNPLWLLSLTPPHPSPISSAHVGLRPEQAAPTFSCLSPPARLLPFPFIPSPLRLCVSVDVLHFFFVPASSPTLSVLFPPKKKLRACGSARVLFSLRPTKAESHFSFFFLGAFLNDAR